MRRLVPSEAGYRVSEDGDHGRRAATAPVAAPHSKVGDGETVSIRVEDRRTRAPGRAALAVPATGMPVVAVG